MSSAEGVFEIREFIDDDGITTSNEVHDVRREFQDLQAQFEKIKKTTGSEAVGDDDAAKQDNVAALLNSISSDMNLSDDDKNSVENIGEDMAFVRELAKLHEQAGRSAETDYLANLEALAASEMEAADKAVKIRTEATKTAKSSSAAGGGSGWKKGFFNSSPAPKKKVTAAAPAVPAHTADAGTSAAMATATATTVVSPTVNASLPAAPTAALKKTVMFHDDLENSASPEPSRPPIPDSEPEPEVSFHTSSEMKTALDPAAGFKVKEEPKKRPAAFSGKIIERF